MFKHRHKKTKLFSFLTALAGFLIWQFSPIPALLAVGSLSDTAKLATLGPRGANSRLNKIIYWLDQARHRGLAPDTTIGIAQFYNRTQEPRAALVKSSLLNNLKIADELGLMTDENRDRLRHGNAAIVTQGPYQGETVEIDHIVPYSLAPEVGNELANLELLPNTLNRRKSNRIGSRQLAHAEKLRAAGLLGRDSYNRVLAESR